MSNYYFQMLTRVQRNLDILLLLLFQILLIFKDQYWQLRTGETNWQIIYIVHNCEQKYVNGINRQEYKEQGMLIQ